MLEIVFHSQFERGARGLPELQQRKLAALIERLRKDPYDSLLHTKRLSPPLIGLFSFRITRDWRVLFRFVDERTIQLTQVAHRGDVYR